MSCLAGFEREEEPADVLQKVWTLGRKLEQSIVSKRLNKIRMDSRVWPYLTDSVSPRLSLQFFASDLHLSQLK